jgi:pimeloyl-ACP methyl ester carboxylesterase
VDLRELSGLDREEVARPWVAAPPPPALVVADREHRPIRALREVARDPVRALKAATRDWSGDRPRATALAEMAVTGREARRVLLASDLRGGELGPDGDAVLAYAHRLHAYLEAGPDARARMAGQLAHDKRVTVDPHFDAPWLAVASELDAPWRPVNVGVTRHTQRDVDLVVPGVDPTTVSARYATIGDLDSERGVVLLLHGLGSRLEEVDVVAEALASHGLGVVAVDLPSQGYSSRVAPEHVGDPARGTYVMPEWDRDEGYAYLGFAERFVVAFSEAIGMRERLVAVGGGSLGGTLSLRLAIHGALGASVRSIAWSPGSVWGTQQTNYVNWAAIEATAGKRLWRAESLADDEARGTHDSRTDYIRWVFESPLAALVKPQPMLWFKGMPLEAEHTAAARADRRELYDHAHRVMCLALAYEQTIYSITEIPRGQQHPRFASIGAPVLVMAGSRDDDMLDIHREVGKLASRMRSHGRRGRIVRLDACHSIHEERPRALAAEIDAFLRDTTF